MGEGQGEGDKRLSQQPLKVLYFRQRYLTEASKWLINGSILNWELGERL
jgi:hypothetical protein